MNIKKSLTMPLLLAVVFLALPATAGAALSDRESASVAQTAASSLLLVTVIGVLYNLWKTTRAYGGIIGQGLRRFGFGIIFLSVEAIDRIAQNFGSKDLLESFAPKYYIENVHDIILLLALFFLALGFSKLSSAVKG